MTEDSGASSSSSSPTPSSNHSSDTTARLSEGAQGTLQSNRGSTGGTLPATHRKPPTKLKEAWDEIKTWTMRRLFRYFGSFIGQWPIACLIAFGVICCLSFGMVKMELRDHLRDGYTPKNSIAFRESKALRDFSGLTGDPMMTTVILLARNKSSMTDPGNLFEAVKLLDYLKNNLTVPRDPNNATSENRRFADFCGHNCMQNDVIDYFYRDLKSAIDDPKSLGLGFTELTYPSAKIMGITVQLERNFFGVRTGNVNNYTNIEYCELIVLTFMAAPGTLEEEGIVARWEKAAFAYANSRSDQEPLEMLVIGAEIVDLEMNKDSRKLIPYFAVGFVSAIVFVCISAYGSFFIYSRFQWEENGWGKRVAILSIPAAVCTVPGAAILVTFGTFSLIGLRVNSLMLIMPFLIMGIGVNDSFLVLHHWLREPQALPRVEMMARVFESVGPSITMTTLTNVISFIICAVGPTEEIALFCLGSSMAMTGAYIFTLIFFGAVLALLSPERGVEDPKPSRCQARVLNFFDRGLEFYAKLLQNNFLRFVFLVAVIGYLAGGFVGLAKIDSKLETEKILPKETPIHRPNRLIENRVWNEYYPVIVMVQKPFDITNKNQRDEMLAMEQDFAKVKGCRTNSTLLWMKDYMKYFDSAAENGVNDIFGSSENLAEIEVGQYDHSQLNGFLSSPLWKHYKGMMNVNMSLPTPVQKFSFVMAYKNHTTWEDRIQIQQEWRAIAENYSNLNVTIWNVNGMFVDQMLSLKDVATSSILYTLMCMVIVCLAFIQKLVPVSIATVSIGSIAIGNIGYIQLWHLDLDPVTICAILMTIGMSVDFTAHISMYYSNCPRTNPRVAPSVHERLRFAIGSIFWPSIQGNLSTIICVLPLCSQHNYIPLVFVKTITLVVIIGTIHGLVLIPMFFSTLPNRVVDFDILTRGREESAGGVGDAEYRSVLPLLTPTEKGHPIGTELVIMPSRSTEKEQLLATP